MFNRICKEEAGEKIYRTVENVEGYFDESNTLGCAGDCRELLFSGEYKYIEVKIPDAERKQYLFGSTSRDFLVEGTGSYRFYVDQKGSQFCDLYYEKRTKIKADSHLKDYPVDVCIAGEKVDSLKSRYSYREGDSKEQFPFSARKDTVIKDRLTGEVMGMATSFGNHGGWINYYYYGGVFGSEKGCSGIASDVHRKIRTNVLRPIK